MTGIRLLFLDIDGVMNNNKTIREHRARPGMSMDLAAICPKRVQMLNEILHKTGARLVLSSSWRDYGLYGPEKTLVRLREEGLDPRHEWYGVTEDFDNFTDAQQESWWARYPRVRGVYNNERVFEVQDFLERQKSSGVEVSHFVILDDLGGFKHLERYQIKTNMDHGLQQEHIERACKLLGVEE
jgi:hypothetical protein